MGLSAQAKVNKVSKNAKWSKTQRDWYRKGYFDGEVGNRPINRKLVVKRKSDNSIW